MLQLQQRSTIQRVFRGRRGSGAAGQRGSEAARGREAERQKSAVSVAPEVAAPFLPYFVT